MPPLPPASLPFRGRYGAPRPPALTTLPLPPARLRPWRGARPLKRWRYVGIYGADVMVCVGAVQVGLAHQSFWAVWEREARRLTERTRLSRGGVRHAPGRVLVADAAADGSPLEIDLQLEEQDGIETICPHGGAYAWTRKQGGIRAHGVVRVGGAEHAIDARGVVDDSAGYHARHTAWRWAAGVGEAADGRALAWNLVDGINDPAQGSERSVWVDGVAAEVGVATFQDDLGGVLTADGGALRFASEAVRSREENLLIVRSSYVQPFGTFAGTLPGGIELASGYGVMERHTAAW